MFRVEGRQVLVTEPALRGRGVESCQQKVTTVGEFAVSFPYYTPGADVGGKARNDSVVAYATCVMGRCGADPLMPVCPKA